MVMRKNKIYKGHAIEVLKTFPNEIIDCCITSPPYYNLRSYNIEPIIWGGDKNCDHTWGEEILTGQTSAQTKYQAAKEAFTQTKSVFCSQCGAWKGDLGGEPTPELFVSHLCDVFDEVRRVLKPTGVCWVNIADSFVDKDLVGVPEMLVLEMKKRRWCRRNSVVWKKNNTLPQSVSDRFTVDFEYLYFFVKDRDQYYFNQQLEPYTDSLDRWGGSKIIATGESLWDASAGQETYRNRNMRPNPKGRNMRCVWSINTEASRVKHWAQFPSELIRRPIEATCPPNGIVLDPFSGSGTTCRVAYDMGRKYIGIDLSNDFVELSEKRLAQTNLLDILKEKEK